MKNSKFWIWFIPVFIIVCIGVYFLLIKTSNEQELESKTNEDAIKIKELYEKNNDIEGYIKVELSKNNIYVYMTQEDINKLIKDGDGIIFFGEASSFAARKEISLLNEVVLSTTIEKIYYVDIANIDNTLENYILSNVNIGEIKAGDFVTIENGKIIEYYDSKALDNDEYLTNEEKELLTHEYQRILKELVSACDEKC